MNSRTWKIRTARDLSLILLLLIAASCTTDRTRRGYLETMAASLPPPARPVIVIPGFGVTRLYDPVTQRHVWGTGRNTIRTRYEDDLDLPAQGEDRLIPRGFAGSRGPVNVAWQLSEALHKYGGYERERNLFTFEYDWRLSARHNAQRLKRSVDRIRREQGAERVDLITHSAGGLVALTYLKLYGGGEAVQNAILIAPVQRGVVDAFRVLVRPERFLRRVFTAEMVATWPFVLELLPAQGRFLIDENGGPLPFDAWQLSDWERFGRKEELFGRLLREARAFRDELDQTPVPSAVRVTVMAGDCVSTVVRALVREDGSYAFYPGELREKEKALAAAMFEPGDGTVPVSSATAGGEAILFCDGHQGIAADPNLHRAILRILR